MDRQALDELGPPMQHPVGIAIPNRAEIALYSRIPASCRYRTLRALKGSTTVSLFIGGLPGLPAGIDLVCQPVAGREASRRGIGGALYSIGKHANRVYPSARVQCGAPHPKPDQTRPGQAVLQLN